MLENTFVKNLLSFSLLALFYSWCLARFPYSALSSVHRGLMALFPSPSPQSSHAGSLCFVWHVWQDGLLFTDCISRRVTHRQIYGNVFCSLFLLDSYRGGLHIPNACHSFLVYLNMRVSVQAVSESVMDREELTTLHITQVYVVQANMSRIPSYGSHRQADLPDRKLTWQHRLSGREKRVVYL